METLGQSDRGKGLWVNDHAARIRLASDGVTAAESGGSVTFAMERVAGDDAGGASGGSSGGGAGV